MIKHPDSHLDHALTAAQINHILKLFDDRQSFFIATFTLPPELGTVPCGLYGPIVGDPPIKEDEVTYAPRGDRAWRSRLIDLPPRQQHEVTVIAGPHEEECRSTHVPTHGHQLRIGGCNGTGKEEHAGMHAGAAWHEETCSKCGGTGKIHHACILYTAFGGPVAPQEPGDVRRQIEALEAERAARHASGEEPALGRVVPASGETVMDAEMRERAKIDPLYAKILGLRDKRAESDAFWRKHALAK